MGFPTGWWIGLRGNCGMRRLGWIILGQDTSVRAGKIRVPDWSVLPEAVPYGKVDDPQSLNLYMYVRDNPLSGFDPDGHNFFTEFAQGLADSTYRPIVQIVEHPVATAQGIGEAIEHPIATGKAIGSAVVSTVETAAHGDGRGIGQIVGTVGMAVAGGAIARGVGVAGELAAEAGEFVGPARSVTAQETYTLRFAEAQDAYPKKAGTIENHHIAPKYLGGAPDGPTVPLDGGLPPDDYKRVSKAGSLRYWACLP